MGWMLKGLALVTGLVSLTLGFWPLWVACFGYLGYSLWSATRKRTVVIKDEEKTGDGRSTKGLFKKRYVASAAFLMLGLVGLSQHGTLSPLLFLSAAVVITLSGVLNRGPSVSVVREVPDSIVLRSRWLPTSWVSLVEVKFATSHISRALSSAGSELIITVSSEKASVYVPIRVFSFSAPDAERKVSAKLAPLARMLSASGAYVLPLDSKEVGSRMNWSLRSVDLVVRFGRDGVTSLISTPFDVLVMAPAGHMLESAAAFVAGPGSTSGTILIPSTGGRLRKQPLMWEALETLGEKHSPHTPDAYTSFLSSVCATRGEGLGDRLENGGETGTGTVLIGSLGAEQVELSRPQLRAIVSAYA